MTPEATITVCEPIQRSVDASEAWSILACSQTELAGQSWALHPSHLPPPQIPSVCSEWHSLRIDGATAKTKTCRCLK